MRQVVQEIKKIENKGNTYKKNNMTKNPLNKKIKEYLKKKKLI